MIEDLKTVAQQAADRARRNGATSADVFIREEESFSVTVRMGDVETLKESVSRSLRLRVFSGKRTATSQTSDFSPAIVEKLVDETLEMARLTSEDESGGLPNAEDFPSQIPDLQLADPGWENFKPADRIELARRAESAALESDPRITNSDGGSFECERARTVLANTLGFVGEYKSTAGYVAAVPIAQANGSKVRAYWLSMARHLNRLEPPEQVGRRAAERTLQRLGARKIKTCQVPVVFDPMTARTLMKHVFDAIAGDAVYRRRSFLVDAVSKPVAAAGVNIVDDARIPAGLGSSPFDDEGVASQRTDIIENGVLRNYLHSAYSARRLHARPTGSGSRTASGSVVVGPTNFYLKPGRYSAEEIVGSIQSGLYVLELLGFGVNSVTGDYSRGAMGLWIENGKLAYPVHEVTIAGNLRQMLQDIEMIGNDITFLGPVAAPTVKIRNMMLSGG
jgi:PmbA protein